MRANSQWASGRGLMICFSIGNNIYFLYLLYVQAIFFLLTVNLNLFIEHKMTRICHLWEMRGRQREMHSTRSMDLNILTQTLDDEMYWSGIEFSTN